MKNAVLTTERLVLREMCREDQAALNKMLQDPEVSMPMPMAFSDEEAEEWLERQLAVTGSMVLACGQLYRKRQEN